MPGTAGAIQIVVTPGSGEGRARATARSLARMLRRRGHEVHVRSFGNLADLSDWAHACPPSTRLIVCIGGDATQSATAAASIRTGVPFVPVPSGFGNLFGRVLGYSSQARAVVRLLADGEVRAVDVGVLRTEDGEEVFLSHRSYGILEQIQHAAERGRRQPRRRLLRLLWYHGVALRLFFGRLAGFQVEVDGVPVADDAVLVTVANVETYHGFLTLTPTASPIDGLLDVFVVPRVSSVGLLRRLLWIMFRLPGCWRGVALYRGRRVRVTTPRRREDLGVRRRVLPLLVPVGALDALRARTVEEGPPVERP
jgi:diacylglycerol kinase (ATP)